MKTLNALDILNAQDVKPEAVDVPEWGGRVFVREFSAGKREEYDALFFDADGKPQDVPNIRARVVAFAACDEQGNAIFTPEHVAALSAKSETPLHRVFDVAARLNKLRKADREAEKKESATPPSGASPTA